MKKHLLKFSVLSAFVLLSGIAISQSLVLSNYTLENTVMDDSTFLESVLTVHNQSPNMVIAGVARTIIYMVPGHEETFCFGPTCYAPGTPVSTDPDTILAGADDNTFYAHLDPHFACGTSSIHYRFFNMNNSADSVGIDLYFGFCTAAGINDLSNPYGISKPTRNPADASTSFKFNLSDNNGKARIEMRNMLGALVKTFPVPQKAGEIFITTSDFKSGLYLCSIINNDRVINTCKLVVEHK